jgi:hypothetical protein
MTRGQFLSRRAAIPTMPIFLFGFKITKRFAGVCAFRYNVKASVLGYLPYTKQKTEVVGDVYGHGR